MIQALIPIPYSILLKVVSACMHPLKWFNPAAFLTPEWNQTPCMAWGAEQMFPQGRNENRNIQVNGIAETAGKGHEGHEV